MNVDLINLFTVVAIKCDSFELITQVNNYPILWASRLAELADYKTILWDRIV